MRYIDTWLNGLGLEYIIPKLKDHGITTPKQLATLSLREIYEVVGVEDSDDRKKLYFLIQRLQTILQYKPPTEEDVAGRAATNNHSSSAVGSPGLNVASPTSVTPVTPPVVLPDKVISDPPHEEEDIRVLRKNRRTTLVTSSSEVIKNKSPTQNSRDSLRLAQVVPPLVSSSSEVIKNKSPTQNSRDSLRLAQVVPPTMHHADLPVAVQSSSNIHPPQRVVRIEDMPIRVVIRKRPLSKSEVLKGDRDVMEIRQNGIVLVHEPKTKVDLTRVVETQTFIFDDSFDCDEPNELIYCRTVKPLVDFIFSGGKATCFAYGQTGSGKTFSMMGCCPEDPGSATTNAGLYVLAARDIFAHTHHKPNLKVVVSCFEIYGTKLFDLLNSRNPVKCLEDSKQQVQIPGLSEHIASSVEDLLEMMRIAHTQRSVGSTGANSESSRSHQILQLQVKDATSKKKVDIERKLSFIDLAGSERGADTVQSSKQTRQEGAEINTSLLALKEVIRSLEKKHGHTPFRGSKLTQVLKDSFIGARTRTCMLACVSPSQINCEHTLNTLRYADRVKEHQVSSGGQVSGGDVTDPPEQIKIQQSLERADSAVPRLRKSPSKTNNILYEEKSSNNPDKVEVTDSLRRRSISQPAGSLTKRNKESAEPKPQSAKGIGKPTGNGVVANRVTEKLKDMNDGGSNTSSQPSDLNSTGTIQKVLELLSAHKLSIAEMVEVMKDEMELVQEMENVEERNTETYLDKLEGILDAKRSAIKVLRGELKSFQKFRSHHHK